MHSKPGKFLEIAEASRRAQEPGFLGRASLVCLSCNGREPLSVCLTCLSQLGLRLAHLFGAMAPPSLRARPVLSPRTVEQVLADVSGGRNTDTRSSRFGVLEANGIPVPPETRGRRSKPTSYGPSSGGGPPYLVAANASNVAFRQAG